jgi:hypothetical protein
VLGWIIAELAGPAHHLIASWHSKHFSGIT